ncbi:hypothetical protein V500_10610 [Pseudogymnoascus sp. VKM F-4518 (FW-2643)]|nr:hypothetical protein V500_10610 [Pseudogymnoascus sp. VKM F-4518 (FW-2643)]
MYDDTLEPPVLLPNPDISGIGAILAMSDAQIVTGLSILIGGFSQINFGLSIFHWHMVVRLAWFSSVTHLTTLTFLRRYIHDNRVVRILRLVLMLVLMIMLAVALIPTGGECGLENYSPWGPSSYTYDMKIESYESESPVYPGSPAKCCFLAMSDKASFIGTTHKFDVMMISEALLIGSTLTRVLKLFRTSSEFSTTWLRHKPAQMCKRIARKLEERKIAGVDFAVTHDSQEDVVLQENSWGFGQLIAPLLLILPLFSLVEGAIEDYTAVAPDEALLSNRPSKEEQPSGLPLCNDPYAELDMATGVDMAKLRRTGDDLVIMENDLGSKSKNSPGLSSEPPLQSEAEPQLRSSIHRWSNKTFYSEISHEMEHVVSRILKGQKASYEILVFLKGQTVAKAKTLPWGPGSTPGSGLVVIRNLIFKRELDTHQIPAIKESPYIRQLVDVIEEGAHEAPKKLVFEWMDTDLWKYRPHENLSHPELLQVISKSILEALAVFQGLNAVHTDISPNNVLLSNLDQPLPIVKHSWKALKAEKASVPKRSRLVPQRYGKAFAPGLPPTSRVLVNVQGYLWASQKIIKDHTDAWCMAKLIRLRGRFDMMEEMERYDEWQLAVGLEAMNFKDPKRVRCSCISWGYACRGAGETAARALLAGVHRFHFIPLGAGLQEETDTAGGIAAPVYQVHCHLGTTIPQVVEMGLETANVGYL